MSDARQMLQQYGLQGHVELLGERRDVPQILQQASLFVLSSRTEGISLTLLEAMASGLPVVATRAGGNSEVVEDGRTGKLVPVGDFQQLADALQSVWQNPEQARRFGDAGRERVERLFDVNRMVRQYEQLYGEVLGVTTSGR